LCASSGHFESNKQATYSSKPILILITITSGEGEEDYDKFNTALVHPATLGG